MLRVVSKKKLSDKKLQNLSEQVFGKVKTTKEPNPFVVRRAKKKTEEMLFGEEKNL